MTSRPHSPRVSYWREGRRKGRGLFLDMSVRDNINVCACSDDARSGGVLNLAKARERATAAIRDLKIRVPNSRVNVGALSGGNQQKVLLSRLLEIRPRVLILDEPTRGVDVAARNDIYDLIRKLAAEGVAIVLISSDFDEIEQLADRVEVMAFGQSGGELTDDISVDAIARLAFGAAEVRHA